MQESVIYQEWQAESEARGQLKARKALALKMLAEGATLDFVARVTEFSIDQIHELQTVHH